MSKQELAVAALRDGTVIDHIPPQALFQCVKILGIELLDKQLTIGNNLQSSKHGAKGIIKVADTFFPEAVLDRISIIAPDAVVNTIRDYEVVEKRRVELPDIVVGIVKCDNPKCITNHEPMRTKFAVIDRNAGHLRCNYCNHTISSLKATLL